MKTIKLDVSPVCPCCSKTLNGCTDPRGEALPSAGDFTVCIYCLEPLVFIQGLLLEPLDVAALEPDVAAEVRQVQAMLADLKAQACINPPYH